MYDIHPLPGSSKSPTLNNPSCSLFAYSDNLHFNQEMTTNTFNSTECTSMNSDQYPHTNNLEAQTNMILPDCQGLSPSSFLQCEFASSSLDPHIMNASQPFKPDCLPEVIDIPIDHAFQLSVFKSTFEINNLPFIIDYPQSIDNGMHPFKIPKDMDEYHATVTCPNGHCFTRKPSILDMEVPYINDPILEPNFLSNLKDWLS